MKIEGNGQEIKRPAQSTDRADIKSKAVPTPSKAQADTVEISPVGKEVGELLSAIDQMPEVREAKVTAAKDSLAEGAYTPDPRKIAEKIISEL